ncbi:MAG: hypothetical protein ACXWQO_07305 [Bdellovibrionota bacterium]
MNKSKQNKIGLKLLGVGLLATAVLVGCGPKAPGFDILPAGQNTFQGSTANNKVDILWVIDNSGSMYTKQQKLGLGFSSFASVFTTKNFDFHMAVATSDIRNAPVGQAGLFQSLPYPYQHPTDPLRSLPANYVGANGPSFTILDNTTPNLVNHFTANAQVGDLGNANATILDGINLTLSSSLLSGANANFIRSDAHLAVIVVSDADDNDSTATVNDVSTYLQTLKPDRFDVITRTYKKNFTVSAVVVSDPTDINCTMPFEDGIKFKAIAAATSGSVANICDANFAAGLTTISQKIAEAITEIPLGRVPDTSTLSITFNGISVANDATNGWTYVSSGNKIVFHGNAIPTDNTSIAINYIPADIIR